MRFIVGPFEQRLLQLTLQQLHETVGVRVVVDATVNRKEHTSRQYQNVPALLTTAGAKATLHICAGEFQLKEYKRAVFQKLWFFSSCFMKFKVFFLTALQQIHAKCHFNCQKEAKILVLSHF